MSMGSYSTVPQNLDKKKHSFIDPYKGLLYTFVSTWNICISNIIVRKTEHLSGSDHLTIFNVVCLFFFPRKIQLQYNSNSTFFSILLKFLKLSLFSNYFVEE